MRQQLIRQLLPLRRTSARELKALAIMGTETYWADEDSRAQATLMRNRRFSVAVQHLPKQPANIHHERPETLVINGLDENQVVKLLVVLANALQKRKQREPRETVLVDEDFLRELEEQHEEERT